MLRTPASLLARSAALTVALGSLVPLLHASVSKAHEPSLYVSDVKDNEILRFDRKGRFVDVFVTSGSGGLEHPVDLLTLRQRRPGCGTGDLIVASRGSMMNPGAVLRYDGETGAFVGVFAEDVLLDWPHDMLFGPEGDLFVGGVRSNNVLRFDGHSGRFLDDFVVSGDGGLVAPHGLVFGPDLNGDGYTDLYVGSRDTDEVLAYDGRGGGFLRVFVSAGSGGLAKPHDVLFGRKGELLVTSHETDEVLRYDRTGAFSSALVTAGSGGLTRPHSLVWGPGKKLFVTSVMSDQVLRYDKHGRFRGVFAEGSGLDRPHGLAFLSR